MLTEMDLTGKTIRNHREAKNYSQEYVASKLGISQPAYAKMEQGKTKILLERLLQISELLEVDQLLDEIRIQCQTTLLPNENPIQLMEKRHQDLKNVYEKLVKTLEGEKQRLIKENERLRTQLAQR